MLRPFEVDGDYLRENIDEMVRKTISDFQSEFLLLPKGEDFIEYSEFRDAVETLKRRTSNFTAFDVSTVRQAVQENARVLLVLSTILGMTLPEWAELARTEHGTDVGQSPARTLARNARRDPSFISKMEKRSIDRVAKATRLGKPAPDRFKALERVDALIAIAVKLIVQGAPAPMEGLVHRLAKFDTNDGLGSVRHAVNEGVPYAMLLYERYLGRPFASHRDAVSELVGEVMENAVEERLRAAGITFRKTKRAEHLSGFDQAPDFCVPDEISPVVVIEAKITSDDGTARDKATRIKNLVTQRGRQVAEGKFKPYEVVACIDGRGFRERREDMRQMLLALNGKVFTTAVLDQLIPQTRLREFVSSTGS